MDVFLDKMKTINEKMEEIHADGLPVSTEIEEPNPEDMEWNVTFENFHREEALIEEDGKVVVEDTENKASEGAIDVKFRKKKIPERKRSFRYFWN